MVFTWIVILFILFILLFWLYLLVAHWFCKPFLKLTGNKKQSLIFKKATISEIKTLKPGKFPLLELCLGFENLSGCSINSKVSIRDFRPHENQFLVGNNVDILLDPTLKSKEPLSLRMVKVKTPISKLLIRILLVASYLLVCYHYLVSKTLSIIASGVEDHTALFLRYPLLELCLSFLFIFLFLKLLLKKTGLVALDKTKHWDLLFHGISAIATVKSFNDTGRLVNHNPVVEFNYEFLDPFGKKHLGRDTKIINKLEVGELNKIQDLEVMYMPEKPEVSRIKSNMGPSGESWFVRAIFLFVVLVFSISAIVEFYKTIT